MKVYVVTVSHYNIWNKVGEDDYVVGGDDGDETTETVTVGVFSSKEIAEQVRSSYINNHRPDPDAGLYGTLGPIDGEGHVQEMLLNEVFTPANEPR